MNEHSRTRIVSPRAVEEIYSQENQVARHKCLFILACLCMLLACDGAKQKRDPRKPSLATATAAKEPEVPRPVSVSSSTGKEDPEGYTNVLMHNVIIVTPKRTRMKVKWMRARMYPIKPGVPASFDDLTSFRFEISEGLMGMNLSDLSTLLREGALKDSPLRNLRIETSGRQLKLTGTLRKLIPLPVQLLADISASPDQQSVRLHTTKISVVRVPFKKAMTLFRLQTSDFFSDKKLSGIKVSGDDIDINVHRLVPEPRASGDLTDVRLWRTGELMEYYGKPRDDAFQVQRWRNFMRMRGGTLNFGKLTMHNADLLLVDTSQSDWLTFDVENYQEQLVNGETHITPSAGLQIFIPDIAKIPASKRNRTISLQWMKDRNVTPPLDIQ